MERAEFCAFSACKIILCIVFSISILIMLSSSCAQVDLEPPHGLTLSQPPISIDLKSYCVEYASNIEASNIKYLNKRIQFDAVTIEKVVRVDPRGDHSELNYFLAGTCEFKLRYPSEMERLTEGTIVNVVGTCLGVSGKYTLIADCWINVIGGGLTVTWGLGY